MKTTGPEGLRWYAVQCKSGESFRAAEHLTHQGYTVFHPVMQREKRQRGKTGQVLEPLFPWYLFIRMNPLQDNWAPVRSTRGVIKLLAFGREPVPVPDALIDTLRQQVSDQAMVSQEPRFQAGERIEITDGPFKALEGLFVHGKEDERVVVLLNILQQEHRITLQSSQIQGSTKP
ncbi:transcription/translation regulatory transformer protein RfaH [Kushneria phyllosphaerae]|uniref:Transcription antitermination protein RfaH n=1 Tax=Kushneria phyllosphaerae TaxID=2100822 RepID=A0A2R8CP33_9GAMM|nr:transcription/translation regulatory transformer protein RfaH [Kushneria phyllosphaerae]SPJ34660.1 Transcription antitermination protein RfaH [Kushneria phyllosphaerae]